MGNKITRLIHEKQELFGYLILLFAMTYTLFHFSLLPYFRPGEFNYLFNQIQELYQKSSIQPEGFILKHIYLPVLKLSSWHVVPVRMLFISLIAIFLFTVYWNKNIFREFSLPARLALCLIFSTSPALIAARDLPAGLFFVITTSIIIVINEGFRKFLADEEGRLSPTTIIATITLSVVSGPLSVLWHLPVILFSYKKSLPHRNKIPSLITGSILPAFIICLISDLRYSGGAIQTNLSTSFESLKSAAGFWLITGTISLVYLIYTGIKKNNESSKFIATGWIFISVSTVLTHLSPAYFTFINALVISTSIAELSKNKITILPYNWKIAIWSVLIVLFFTVPFSLSSSIFTSKQTDNVIRFQNQISTIQEFMKTNNGGAVAPIGSSNDTATALCLSLFADLRGHAFDPSSKSLPDSIAFLCDANSYLIFQKEYYVKALATCDQLKIIQLSGNPYGFKSVAPTTAEAEKRLQLKLNEIKGNAEWTNALVEKAVKNGNTPQVQMTEDALWLLENEGLITSSQRDSILQKK